jgi:hypothetical protein
VDTTVGPARPRSDPAPERWRRPGTWLVVVAALHAASPLVALGLHWPLGIDETVYLSQINAHVPPGFFSAPRARGSTLLAAPVTELTTSIAAVRVWLAVLSGIGLYLAFRPWLRVRAGAVVPLAAAVFSSLWVVTYYAFTAMPNEWVAFGTLGGVGCAVVHLREGGRRWWIGTALAVAVIGLFRPSDAGFTVAGLLLALPFVASTWRRRAGLVAGLAAGAVAGVVEWVVEAFTSFGGLGARVRAAQADQGGGGFHLSIRAEERVLPGPLLCRAGCHPHSSPVFRVWWIVLAVLLLLAILAAVRAGIRTADASTDLVTIVVGAAVAAQYLFTVGYGAPRFLVPAYAMLSIPAVSGARALLPKQQFRPLRFVFAAGLIGVLGLATGVQADTLRHDRADSVAGNVRNQAQVADLRRLGVHAPCVLLGVPYSGAVPVLAYRLRCTDRPQSTGTVAAEVARGEPVLWIRPTAPPVGRGAPDWRRIRLTGQPVAVWLARSLGTGRLRAPVGT